MKFKVAVVVGAACLALLGACNKQGVEESGSGTEPVPSLASPGDVKEIRIEGTEYSYSPDQLEAPAGKALGVTFANVGGIDHDWTLAGSDGTQIPGAHLHVTPGSEATAIITLEPGEYVFWCSLAGHREAGMEGTLTVG